MLLLYIALARRVEVRAGKDIPERIAYNEEGDVHLIGVFQNIVARRLDHFTVGNNNGTAIESFLLPRQLVSATPSVVAAHSPARPSPRATRRYTLPSTRAPPSSQFPIL